MARRDEWLQRTARSEGRRPRTEPTDGTLRRVTVALVLGWLVLMTVWGVGRSGFAEHEPWFLGAGLVAGVATAATRIASGRQRTPRR